MAWNVKKPSKNFVFIATLSLVMSLVFVSSFFRERNLEKRNLYLAKGKRRYIYKQKVDLEVAAILKEREKRDKEKALIYACECGDFEKVKKLISQGVNIDCHNDYRETPLAKAAEKGKFEIAKFLIEKGAKVDTYGLFGQTPLFCAASKGHSNLVKLLLENGANVNSYDTSNCRPLDRAAMNDIESVKILLDYKAEINYCDIYGYSPLHYAVAHFEKEIVIELLKRGADINFSSEERKFTPLMALAFQDIHKGEEAIAMAQFLLKCGADPLIISSEGKKASDYASDLKLKNFLMSEEKRVSLESAPNSN